MLTTTVAGRTWNFSHAIGRFATSGHGFSQPTSVAIAPGGVLYVVNRGNELLFGERAESKRINKLTIDEEFVGEFGRDELSWPASLAVDKDGNLFCSDEHENLIAIYSSDGDRLGQWGESGCEEGQLSAPSGIVFDADDNLYVVDAGNDRVQRFTKDGRLLSGWGSPGDGPGQFNCPWGITIDRQGDVYVADWRNNRIQKFSPDGTFLLSISKTVGDGLDLNHPAGVAVDSEGDIYVTDWGNKCVRIFEPGGDILTTLWGDAHVFSKWGKQVVESNADLAKAHRRLKDANKIARFHRPSGIVIDDEDRIIISEPTRARLQVYVKEKDYMDPQFNL